MVPKKKPHRRTTSWKKDITLLTCILRLRSQPSVPYSEIAQILLTTLPSHTQHLFHSDISHPNPTSEIETETILLWLTTYLESIFTNAENSNSAPWLKARYFSAEAVGEILRVTGLAGRGYEVSSEEEVRVQVKWRRVGDWRAGSVPDCRIGRLRDREKAVRAEKGRSGEEFEAQLEEVERAIEEGKNLSEVR